MKLYEKALELGKKTIIIPPKQMRVEENDKMRLPLTSDKKFHSSSIILISGNPLIKPEGSVIDLIKGHDIKQDHTKFDINEEENREKTAIETLIKENNKKLTHFYLIYATELKMNELNREVSKKNLMKLIRDIALSDNVFSLEDLTSLIRNYFGHPLSRITLF